VKNIRRATRRHFSAEDKIRIVLEGLRGEDSIAGESTSIPLKCWIQSNHPNRRPDYNV
jgi:hypothetical protein